MIYFYLNFIVNKSQDINRRKKRRLERFVGSVNGRNNGSNGKAENMEKNHGKKAALHNLGCKVNAYETEAMQQLLEGAGYEIVPFKPGADVYVINTCSVTNMADRKSRQMLHKAKKLNPDAVIVAAGCYVQTAKERTGLAVEADIILGNNKKQNLLEALEEYDRKQAQTRGEEAVKEEPEETQKTVKAKQEAVQMGQKEQEAVSAATVYEEIIDINHTKEYETLFISRTEEHTRAYIKVQDGCNQFCSYCMIPYARGRARSREMDDVLRELGALAANGVKEVVLTGIHLSSYGKDLGTSLLELMKRTAKVEGIERIRLGSLEPGIITEEFAGEISQMSKVCPHFHLSLQSGCDTVLKRMNRRYTAGEYLERCNILRKYFEHPALTTDVIVGFPGETEEEFVQTVEFLKKVQFYETHIFKYSKRKGTKAAIMPDQVPEKTKGERSDVLLALNDVNKKAYEEAWLGHSCQVLFEEKVMVDGQEYFTGYTKEYIKTYLPADQDYENQILTGNLEQGENGLILFRKEFGKGID